MRKRVYKRLAALVLAAALSLPLTGCGIHARELTADIRQQTFDTATDLAEGGEAVSAFALALLQNTDAGRKSTLLSPLSALYALGMTANGASGDTLTQLEGVTGMTLAELNDYLYTFRMSLPDSEGGTTLALADSLWMRDIFLANEDFLRACVNYYDAEVYSSAFDGSVVADVNRWVEKHTGGMIEQLLEEPPSAQTMLYLVNAAVFDGKWQTPYKKANICDGVFNALSGEKQPATFLRGTETIYLSGYGAEGFLKPYADGRYAFAALLPEAGTTLAELLSTLNGEKLYALLSEHQYATVVATMPKFTGETSLSLRSALQAMGVTDLFDMTAADLRQMGSAPNDQLHVGDVLQKTYIAVDEKGTKAAAATSVNTNDAAAMPEKYITLDRPFLYMIVDTHACLPLFTGTVTELQ